MIGNYLKIDLFYAISSAKNENMKYIFKHKGIDTKIVRLLIHFWPRMNDYW